MPDHAGGAAAAVAAGTLGPHGRSHGRCQMSPEQANSLRTPRAGLGTTPPGWPVRYTRGTHRAGAPGERDGRHVLDRYLRVRARHKDAALPWLWLGLRGRFTAWGLVQMLRHRGEEAGLPGLHPTSFATPSPISGSPKAAARPTSYAWPAGAPAPCRTATVPRPPTSAPAKPTGASPPASGSAPVYAVCAFRASRSRSAYSRCSHSSLRMTNRHSRTG
jgi:hypothetical protein